MTPEKRDAIKAAFAAKNRRRKAEKASLGKAYAQVRAWRRSLSPAGAFGREKMPEGR